MLGWGLETSRTSLESSAASIHSKFIYQGLVGPIILHNEPVDMDPEVASSWGLPGVSSMLSRHLVLMNPALMMGLLHRLAFRAAIAAYI